MKIREAIKEVIKYLDSVFKKYTGKKCKPVDKPKFEPITDLLDIDTE